MIKGAFLRRKKNRRSRWKTSPCLCWSALGSARVGCLVIGGFDRHRSLPVAGACDPWGGPGSGPVFPACGLGSVVEMDALVTSMFSHVLSGLVSCRLRHEPFHHGPHASQAIGWNYACNCAVCFKLYGVGWHPHRSLLYFFAGILGVPSGGGHVASRGPPLVSPRSLPRPPQTWASPRGGQYGALNPILVSKFVFLSRCASNAGSWSKSRKISSSQLADIRGNSLINPWDVRGGLARA